MTIEISKETEQLVNQAAKRGKFRTVEAFLSAVAEQYLRDDEEIRQQVQREESWRAFRKPLNLESLIKQQGVKPIEDPSCLKFEDWPEDDPVEDFIKRAKGLDVPPTPEGIQ